MGMDDKREEGLVGHGSLSCDLKYCGSRSGNLEGGEEGGQGGRTKASVFGATK